MFPKAVCGNWGVTPGALQGPRHEEAPEKRKFCASSPLGAPAAQGGRLELIIDPQGSPLTPRAKIHRDVVRVPRPVPHIPGLSSPVSPELQRGELQALPLKLNLSLKTNKQTSKQISE